MTIAEKYIKEYSPLMDQFIKEIEGINSKGLPLPHLPVYGNEFAKNPYKIAFVGWETRDSVKLGEFISTYKKRGIEEVLKW